MYIRFFSILFLAVIFTPLAAASPNLVFIIADDCTFRDIGCYGGQARTPHIDRLATQGMRFERCFRQRRCVRPHGIIFTQGFIR